jgi:hypothetical protein
VEILIALWENLQEKTVAHQAFEAGLSTGELYSKISPDRDQAKRRMISHRLRRLARHTELVISKSGHQRVGHGVPARIYSLSVDTAITRPATAMIVESILDAAARFLPERDLVKQLYESKDTCGESVKDTAQIFEEIEFAIACRYLERVDEGGRVYLRASRRTHTERRYISALASKCRQIQPQN